MFKKEMQHSVRLTVKLHNEKGFWRELAGRIKFLFKKQL